MSQPPSYGPPPPGGTPPGGSFGGPPPGDPPPGDPPPGGLKPSRLPSAWLWISLGCGGLFVIGVVLVLLLVFVFAGGDPEDEDGNGGDASAPTGTGLGREVRSNPDLPGLGEPVEHEGLRLTVTDVETGHEGLHGFDPIGEFVVVYVEVTPTSNDYTSFWRDEQNLYTYDGVRVEEHFDATWAHGGEDDMLIMLSAGQTHETSIVFDVDDPAEISHMGLSARTNGGNEVNVDVTG